MKFHYRCGECGAEYEISPDRMVCPSCAAGQKPDEPLRGVLETIFEGTPGKDLLFDLLPVEKEYFPPIPVGGTPLWQPARVRRSEGFPELSFKDATAHPTGSFKDRASFLVAAFARRHGIRDIVVASTGNAASSMAGVGAAAHLNVKIFIPKSAPKAKMVQSLQYGAEVTPVDGTYDAAFDRSLAYSAETGGLSRNTAYNPLTIEGKKTAAIEIFLQLSGPPDAVFVPTGDGVILAGIYKGFKDLMKIGLMERMPVIYAVQAEGSSAIARALASGGFGKPVPSATIADSISVDVPRNGFYALRELTTYGGKAVTVSDQEILDAQHRLASTSGLFAEPSSSAAYAGFRKVKGDIDPSSKVVILVTGSGLKDIDAAMRGVSLP